MSVARQIAYIIASTLVAMAQAVATATRMVWDGGKWVLKSVASPAPQAPAAGAAAADAMAALAEVGEAAAPAPVALPSPEPVDPILEWGALAQSWAVAQSTLNDEPRLDGILDEAAIAWLKGLYAKDLMHLTNVPARRVGEHMLSQRLIDGVPICPTPEEFRQAQREAAEMDVEKRARMAEGRNAIQSALDDLVSSPGWEPVRGIC